MSLLRRAVGCTSSSALVALSSTAAAVAAPSSVSSSISSSSCCVTAAAQCRHLHGSTKNNTVRTQHNAQWFARTKGHMLTGRDSAETLDRPPFPSFAEDVDRPIVMPDKANCFACGADIHAKKHMTDAVWIPSGGAAVPTPQGYFFCKKCFKCSKCKFRFVHNKFYTVNDKAVCVRCALGREVVVPTRRWHSSYVRGANLSSRMSGQAFPRFKHELEFLYSPEK